MDKVESIFNKIKSSNRGFFISKILLGRQISRLNLEEYAMLMKFCFESNSLSKLTDYGFNINDSRITDFMQSETFSETDSDFREFLYLNAMENEFFSDEELEKIFNKAPLSYSFLKKHEDIRQASKFKSNLKALSYDCSLDGNQIVCLKALIEGNFNPKDTEYLSKIQEMFLYQIALSRFKKREYPNNGDLFELLKNELKDFQLKPGSLDLDEILSNYEGTIDNNLLKDILDFCQNREQLDSSYLKIEEVSSAICLSLIEKENLNDREILKCFYTLIPNGFEKNNLNIYYIINPDIMERCDYYDFSDNKYSLINKSILEDESTIKMLIENRPELILFSNCKLDDQTIEAALKKLDMNKLKTSLDFIQKTGVYDYLGSTVIFTNEVLAEKIMKEIPNLFLLLKGETAKSEKLYKLFKESGGELDSLNNNDDIYENPALIKDYKEKLKGREAIIEEASKQIGFAPFCFLRNEKVLDDDVVNEIRY
ncbi:MAG: hypothetical protein K6D97_08230 [Clostridia bacterium]|nr:hypothetical protein [Clostridia bacterium]